MILHLEEIVDSKVTSTTIDEPQLEEVMAAIRALDGDSRTQLWLDDSAGGRLQVTGPVGRRLAIDHNAPDGTYGYAVDDTQPTGVVDVPAGYETVELPLRGLVEAELAESIVVAFLSSSAGPLPGLWEEP